MRRLLKRRLLLSGLALSVAIGMIGASPRTSHCSPGSAGCASRDPYNDGCSDPWFARFATEWGHENFKPACIRHDNCYHHGSCSYAKTKDQCDQDFLADMRQICANLPLARAAERPICETQAPLFYEAVSTSQEAAQSYLGANGYLFCYEGMRRCDRESCTKAPCVLDVRHVGSSLWWWQR